jgi:hypothetical protein
LGSPKPRETEKQERIEEPGRMGVGEEGFGDGGGSRGAKDRRRGAQLCVGCCGGDLRVGDDPGSAAGLDGRQSAQEVEQGAGAALQKIAHQNSEKSPTKQKKLFLHRKSPTKTQRESPTKKKKKKKKKLFAANRPPKLREIAHQNSERNRPRKLREIAHQSSEKSPTKTQREIAHQNSERNRPPKLREKSPTKEIAHEEEEALHSKSPTKTQREIAHEEEEASSQQIAHKTL